MRETFQNILNVIVIIFFLVAAILFYKQQKAISQLSSMLKNQNNIAVSGKNEGAKVAVADLADQVKKGLEDNTRLIEGRLVSVSSDVLTVEADMPDLKKMKEDEAVNKSFAEKPSLPPTYKKTFTATVDSETKFTANKMDGLKIGDTVHVVAKELVYKTDKLTAVEITSPFNK